MTLGTFRHLPKFAFALLAVCLMGAVLVNGGLSQTRWAWIGGLIAVGAGLVAASGPRRIKASGKLPELFLLCALLVWFCLQLVPFPSGVIGVFSPLRWQAVQAARLAVGENLAAPLALSVAPAATFTLLVWVLPVMAAFLAAREIGCWGKGRRIWLAVAPLVLVAFLESVLGMIQYSMGSGWPEPNSASGTYVNRNHFAGLLEMALPLAVAWAASLWWEQVGESVATRRPAGTVILTIVAACMFIGLMLSLSRMGFVAGLFAVAVVGTGFLRMQQLLGRTKIPAWVWPLPTLAVGLIVVFTTTSSMILRLAETGSISSGFLAAGRLEIWRGTLSVIRAYPFMGVGLGALEHAFYPYQNFLPGFTVDYAHNDYLQIFAELGIGGGLLVMALAGVIGWRLFSALRRPHPQNWPLALGLLGSLTAIALHSLVDFNLYIPANALVIAWLAGLAVSPGLRRTRLPLKKPFLL